MSCHRNGVKPPPSEPCTQSTAHNAILPFFRRLSDDPINRTSRGPKNHPGKAAADPDGRISIRLGPCLVSQTHQYAVKHLCHKVEDETKQNAQGQSKGAAKQRFSHRALHDTFGNPEADAHERDDDWDQQEISPAVRRAIDESRFTDGPTGHGTQKSRQSQVKPSLEQDAPTIGSHRHQLFRRLVDGAVYAGTGGGTHRRDHGRLRNGDLREIVGRDPDSFAITWAWHRPPSFRFRRRTAVPLSRHRRGLPPPVCFAVLREAVPPVDPRVCPSWDLRALAQRQCGGKHTRSECLPVRGAPVKKRRAPPVVPATVCCPALHPPAPIE